MVKVINLTPDHKSEIVKALIESEPDIPSASIKTMSVEAFQLSDDLSIFRQIITLMMWSYKLGEKSGKTI